MNNMNRFDKIDYLIETCSEEFVKNQLLNEMVQWMGESDFTEFFEHLCRNWDIINPEEETEEVEEETVE